MFCNFLNKYFGEPGVVLGSRKVLEEGVKDEQDIAWRGLFGERRLHAHFILLRKRPGKHQGLKYRYVQDHWVKTHHKNG